MRRGRHTRLTDFNKSAPSSYLRQQERHVMRQGENIAVLANIAVGQLDG